MLPLLSESAPRFRSITPAAAAFRTPPFATPHALFILIILIGMPTYTSWYRLAEYIIAAIGRGKAEGYIIYCPHYRLSLPRHSSHSFVSQIDAPIFLKYTRLIFHYTYCYALLHMSRAILTSPQLARRRVMLCLFNR